MTITVRRCGPEVINDGQRCLLEDTNNDVGEGWGREGVNCEYVGVVVGERGGEGIVMNCCAMCGSTHPQGERDDK